MKLTAENISRYFKSLQKRICRNLETIDGHGKFREDAWRRKGGGGGRTAVMHHGAVIEKGGVNFSLVKGKMPESLAETLNLAVKIRSNPSFIATGISIVIHPISPMVPIIHMNLRYFEIGKNKRSVVRWFGGGIDLTPHYVNEDDARFFHRSLKEVCDRFHSSYYPDFKKEADDYFYLPHRGETRGIGGLFFDRLNAGEGFTLTDRFEFLKAVGESFVTIYSELVMRNKKIPYGDREKQWQSLRRSRYAEFNLLYDRGTRFGLLSRGRIESIFMSMPPKASWDYNPIPKPGSPEEKTLRMLRKGANWIK